MQSRRARDGGDRRAAASSATATRRARPKPRRAPISSSSAVPVGACGDVAKEIAPGAEARRHRLRCRLGEGVGHPRRCSRICPKSVHFVPAHPVAGTEHSGPEAGFAELFQRPLDCILTPPPGTDPRRGRAGAGVLDGARRECRDHGGRAPRPGARHHQPCAASDRLQHRRHGGASRRGDAVGGDEVRRRRLPRFHPHRRVRPDHVARRVPEQQARRCWRCSAASART